MKVDQIKHNHTLTDILKFSIFSLLMLAPMINVGVRSAYVICNKNAYQSYSGATSNEYTQTQLQPNSTMFKIGNTYTYNNQIISYSGDSNRLEIVPQGNTFKLNNAIYLNVATLVWYKEGTSTNYFYYRDTTNHYSNLNINMVEIEFTVQQFTFTNSNFDNPMFTYFYEITYQPIHYLDNVFEYSVSQLEESSLYNWVETTGIYTTFNTMNTQLGITNTAIALLLSYWFLLTVIYVIIDIIIKVFTTVTHMIGIKTA